MSVDLLAAFVGLSSNSRSADSVSWLLSWPVGYIDIIDYLKTEQELGNGSSSYTVVGNHQMTRLHLRWGMSDCY